MGTGGYDSRSLRIIRLALAGGVLLFGCVAWYLTQSRPAAETPVASPLNLVFALVAIGCLGGLAAVRIAQSRVTDPAQARAITIAGWAMGEAPALVGGVVYFLTGQPLLYLVGFAMLLASFVIVPIQETP